MSSCLLPTIQILQPTTTNPVLRPTVLPAKSQSAPSSPSSPLHQRRKKPYPLSHNGAPSRFPRMRLILLRNSALCSLLGLGTAQSSTWAQTQPFDVDVSTESLLGTSQQPLTNVVASSTPATTELAPVATVTDEFSTSIPTELSEASTGAASTSVVVVTSVGSTGASASASASRSAASERSASSQSESESASASASSATSRASSSGTGAAVQSTAAAAPGGVNGQHKMMGVAGALAGAAGVLFV
ncbi:hypothetical protein SVAN01_02409 [Stagonosporopsis vannaccii]|nr:hypothetical protein SVAN01_02409 [Stagonosporopsis vannaccii]